MTKKDLQKLEETLLAEFQTHRASGAFDVHAAGITRLYEILYLVVQHLNRKKTK